MKQDIVLFMAPMAGVTNRVFRKLVKENGADIVCTEMMSVQGIINRNEKTFSLLDLEKEENAGVQLFGREPEDFVRAVEIIKEKASPSFIDINMGCPVPKIVKSGMGAALLREPGRAEEIVRSLVRENTIPVTVKIRLGWSPQEKTGLEVALRCQDAGAPLITIHGRTRDQFYSGKADWETISSIREKLEVPVVANGDVFSAGDALKLKAKTDCNKIMIGRGALGNPWIFREIKGKEKGEEIFKPGKDEIMETIDKHIRGLIELRGSEKRAIPEMRKHLGWYVKGFPGAREIRNSLMRVEKAEEVKFLMEKYFQQVGMENSK